MFRVLHDLSIPTIIINHLNGSTSSSSNETNRNILLLSSLTHVCYTSHTFQPPYLITLIMRDINQNAVLVSHPCELNVPPIWMFLFNYSNDIRWEAQITNLKKQNLLRALHIWPIPSVLSLSSEVYKLLSSLFGNSLLSPSCEVHWKQLSPLSGLKWRQLSSFWGTLLHLPKVHLRQLSSFWGTLLHLSKVHLRQLSSFWGTLLHLSKIHLRQLSPWKACKCWREDTPLIQ